MTATRMFNYAHFLSGFDYEIEYRNTTCHGNADYLSRFPTELQQNDILDSHSLFQMNQLDTLNITSQTIADETAKDVTLGPIVRDLSDGRSVEKYGYHDNELTIQDGCILKGWRVMIPNTLVQYVLQELHTAHIGLSKMKALARSFCSWKNMDRDIELMVSSCKQCIEKKNIPPKVIHPWEPASGPWERIHIDYAGPTDGQQYLIVVDSFTKWVEVVPTRTTTSAWTINELSKLFCTFGFPYLLVSDNGGQFTSQEFKHFLASCGTTHKTIAPHHPNSNGQVERYCQTVKNCLNSMMGERGNLQNKINRLLMQLRQAPNSTGTSSYHLMFGREIRTNLSLLRPGSTATTRSNSIVGIRRQLKPGDRVQARSFQNRKIKWSLGRIEGREGNVQYRVKMDNGQVWKRHIDQLIKIREDVLNN